MSTKLESETFAGKSMQAWREAANQAGLVLRAPEALDSGDYPQDIYSSLRLFRRNIAITKNHKKIITTMSRQLVTIKDDRGKPRKVEYLTYQGYYAGTTHRGQEFNSNFEIGKYKRIRSHHFMGNRWGNSGNSVRIYFSRLQNHYRPKRILKICEGLRAKENVPDL